MAEWSSSYIRIKGEKETLEKVADKLNGMMNTEEGVFDLNLYTHYPNEDYSQMVLDGFVEVTQNVDSGEHYIVINGEGRHAMPVDFFKKHIFEAFKLSGVIMDECKANDFFIKKTFENGVTTEDIDTAYLSVENALEWGAYDFAEQYFSDVQEDVIKDPAMNIKEGVKEFYDLFTDPRIGWSEEEFRDYFDLQKKQILFIVGNPATGKTTLAETLSTKGYGIVKSVTTRPKRDESEEKWYRFVDDNFMNDLSLDFMEKSTYGEHRYGTLKDDLFGKELNTDRLVKVIEPKGLEKILKSLNGANGWFENYPLVDTCVVLMSIDRLTAHENLKKEGYTPEEIEKRLNREDVLLDMLKLGIKPDIVVSELNENTWSDVHKQANEFFLQKEVERAEISEAYHAERKNDFDFVAPSHDQETAPTPAPAPSMEG